MKKPLGCIAGSVLLGLWAAAGMAADEKAASRTEGKPLRVLLIGNSYSCAPLFDVVSGMAKAAGERPLDYTWVGGGGWLLQWQWETPAEYLKRPDFNGVNKSLKALREGTWDIVVLQSAFLAKCNSTAAVTLKIAGLAPMPILMKSLRLS